MMQGNILNEATAESLATSPGEAIRIPAMAVFGATPKRGNPCAAAAIWGRADSVEYCADGAV